MFLLHIADIALLKTQMASVAVSLSSMCDAIDAATNALTPSSIQMDCCSNEDNLQTRCDLRTNVAALQSITSPGNVGQCLQTDAQCNVAV